MIFILGNICRDTTFYVGRLPLPGETVNADRLLVGLGGKGLNQAIAASNTGAGVRLVAGIGEDWTAGDAASVCKAAPVGLELALVRKPGSVDCSSIMVSAAGENVIVTHAAQAEALSIDDAAPHLNIKTGDLLLLQCNLQPELARFAAYEAKRAGARVIFNPAPYKPWARSLEDVLDVAILNRQEAVAWTGKITADAAITDINVPLSIVTLGNEGCLACRSGEAAKPYPAPKVEAVDTTGAGDTFVGVFAAEWLATTDEGKAMDLALKAASASVSKTGAAASIPSRQDIDRLRSQRS